MDIKKLNEELQKFIVNEISGELAAKVYNKRLQQKQKLNKILDKNNKPTNKRIFREIRAKFQQIVDMLKDNFEQVYIKSSNSEFVCLYIFNNYQDFYYGVAVYCTNEFKNNLPIIKCVPCIKNNNKNTCVTLKENAAETLDIFCDCNEIINVINKQYNFYEDLALSLENDFTNIYNVLKTDNDVDKQTLQKTIDIASNGFVFDIKACYKQTINFLVQYDPRISFDDKSYYCKIRFEVDNTWNTTFDSIKDFKNNYKNKLERIFRKLSTHSQE